MMAWLPLPVKWLYGRRKRLGPVFPKHKIVCVIPDFFQTGTLHVPNAVLKEGNGRHKPLRAFQNLHNQNRLLLDGFHAGKIRFNECRPVTVSTVSVPMKVF